MNDPAPAQVNARMAALSERRAAGWRVPEDLHDAVDLWGGGCNDHGVFTRYERVEVARLSDTCHAAVLLAKSGVGLYAYGLEYRFGTGGGDFAPCVWRDAYGSRDEARQAAVADLAAHLKEHGNGTPDRQQKLLLAKVRQQGQQRTLFD